VWRVPAESVAEVAAAQREELSLTAAALTAARPHWHPTAVAAKLDGIARVRPEVAERAFTDTQAAGGWDLVDAAASLSIPTLVVRGDPAVFTMLQGDVLDAVRRRNPRVSTVTIPGTGHAPHRDDPDATVATVRDWLRSIGIG
jgi:pimeloyl-ACP methyl ester carboxylesterase